MLKTVVALWVGSVLVRGAEELRPDRIVPYKQLEDVELTLHVFDPPGHSVEDKCPAIVFFFGGGWVNGDPSLFYKQAAYLASRGMVAMCADYRTAKRHGTSPQACVKDGKSAMRWVRANAAELGVDPNRLAAGGGSAGGHVAAATALIDGFNEGGDDLRVSPRPDALVLFNPVFDNSPEGYGYKRVQAYWQDFSPMHHIDAEAPPTLVMLGTVDKLIPVDTAEKYKHLMEAAGVRCDLKLYEGQAHGFFNNAKYDETLSDMDRFLVSLGYLNEME